MARPSSSSRRRLLAALAAAAAPCAGWAQPAPASPSSGVGRRYAVASFIGDEIVLVHAVATVGSHIDRNPQRPLPDPNNGFDGIAGATVAGVVERLQPGARVDVLHTTGATLLHRQPEQAVAGGSIALPDAVVTAIEKSQATHVLLLTKLRAPARLRFVDGRMGVGSLRGLGYYIDRTTWTTLVDTGATAEGYIAAYAYLQLTLADARTGAVLASRDINADRVYPLAANQKAVGPWEALTAEQKVNMLRRLLEATLEREVPLLLAGS